MRWRDAREEVVAERQLLVWKSIKWEPVGSGLAVGQCREEAEAEGGSYISNIFRGPKSSLLLGGMYRIISFSSVELLLLHAFPKIRIQPCVTKSLFWDIFKLCLKKIGAIFCFLVLPVRLEEPYWFTLWWCTAAFVCILRRGKWNNHTFKGKHA